MATAKRQALFVLGMHRSGTSAFSGVFANLGAQAPKTLMVPTKDNPQGYWESLELLKAHDRILDSAGSRWNDWGPFNPAWIETAAAEEFIALIPKLIKSEFGDASLILIKDPRVCRFFPLWQIALRRLRITPKVVIPVRHPLEVARSLESRDHFGRNRSLLLWLRHVLDAEASTREVARTFVRYDQLLEDWQTSARKISRDLDIPWPKWSGDTESRITDFLSSELRHHSDADKPVPGGGELADWVNQTYQVLQQLAEDGQPAKPALESLDRIRHEFDRTSAMYAAVVREHETRMEGLYGEKKAELADKSQQLGERNKKYEDLAQSYSTNQQSLADLQSRIVTLKAELGEKTKALGERNQKYEQLALSYTTAEQSIAKLRSKTDSVTEQLAERTRQLGERNTKYEELARSYSNAQQSLAEHKSRLAEKTQELGERNKKYEDLARGYSAAQQSLAEHKARAAVLADQLESRHREQAQMLSLVRQDIEAMAARLAARDTERNELAVILDKATTKAETQAREIADLREAAAKSAVSVEERFKETAKLTSMVFELEEKLSGANQALVVAETLRGKLVDENQALTEQVTSLRVSEAQRERRLALLEHALAGRSHEIARQGQWIDFHRRHAAKVQSQLDAIQTSASWKITKPFRARQRMPDNDAPMPPDDDAGQQIALLQGSELFDSDWYLHHYPEVAESGLEPAHHFLRSGSASGYNPSTVFDTVEYLVRYPDVRLSGMNPLVHYIEYGSKEGRVATAGGTG